MSRRSTAEAQLLGLILGGIVAISFTIGYETAKPRQPVYHSSSTGNVVTWTMPANVSSVQIASTIAGGGGGGSTGGSWISGTDGGGARRGYLCDSGVRRCIYEKQFDDLLPEPKGGLREIRADKLHYRYLVVGG